MKTSLSATLLLLALLTACGKGSSNFSTGKLVAPINENEIQEILNKQSFECAGINGASCPEGIARLFIVNKEDRNKSAYCTGVMVNKNTLVTNVHCISSQDVCDRTYLAVYNGHSYHQSKCSQVRKLITDHLPPDNPLKVLDIAIVKIQDEYPGKTFKLATKRPLPQEALSAWVIDQTGLNSSVQINPYESRVTQFNCRVSSQTARRSLILENCPIINGNSGSPVVNGNGELVSIIWGGTALQMDSQWDLYERRAATEYVAASTEVYYFSAELNK